MIFIIDEKKQASHLMDLAVMPKVNTLLIKLKNMNFKLFSCTHCKLIQELFSTLLTS